MDIMRNNKTYALRFSNVLPFSVLLLAAPAWAKFELKPTIGLTTHAYQLKYADNGTDRGLAEALTPGLELSYETPWLRSSLSAEQMALIYRDEQRDNESYTYYRLNNQASFLREQLLFRLGAAQSYRSANANLSRYADEISSSGDMAKTNTQNAGISFKNQQFNWFNTNFDINATRSSADKSSSLLQTENPFEVTALDNNNLSGAFELRSRTRSTKFFYGVSANGSKADREYADDFYNRQGYGVIGVPFFWRVAMIAQGRYENSSELSTVNPEFAGYRNFHSVGGGFEWAISDRSWWNVTYNKINEKFGVTEYVATQFNFQPSRRTKLSGSLDRRFFGRTAELNGSYTLKNLSMQIAVKDSVNSLMALNTDQSEFGLFVCPPGVTPGLASCFQPPTAQYRPQPGERYYNIRLPGDELNESLVVRRSASYTIGYSFSKLKLQFQLGERRDLYLEQATELQDRFANVTANWQLTARNSVTLSSAYSKLSYQGEEGQATGFGFSERQGTEASNSVAFNRKINTKLDAALTAKRIDVNFVGRELDYQENRVSLDLNLKF